MTAHDEALVQAWRDGRHDARLGLAPFIVTPETDLDHTYLEAYHMHATQQAFDAAAVGWEEQRLSDLTQTVQACTLLASELSWRDHRHSVLSAMKERWSSLMRSLVRDVEDVGD